MKVEFTSEEVWSMVDSVVEQLVALKLGKKDRATLRRWRDEEVTPGSPLMKLLTEKANAEIQRSHDRTEVTPIVKPDWAQ